MAMDTCYYIESSGPVPVLKKPHPVFKVDVALSPYVGCAGGCRYCPHASEGKIGIKTDFLNRLEAKLSTEKRLLHLGLGCSCEPYNAAEKDFKLSHSVVELAVQHKLPLQIFTKSSGIRKDAALLKAHSDLGLLAVSVSVFTIDRELALLFEPGVEAPEKRFELVQELRKKELFCGLVLSPIIPYVSDTPEQLEGFFERAKKAGADYILPQVLSLRSKEVRKRMTELVGRRFPRILHRLKNLYENDRYPAITYCGRINDLLASLSEKYGIPLFLPVEHESGSVSEIRQELLP